MEQPMTKRISQWRTAWICFVLAIGLHVADEAMNGFIRVYNDVVGAFRAKHPWAPMPILTFPVWLGILIFVILFLFALSPLVSRGKSWIRWASIALSVLMIGNAFAHVGASLHWGKFVPGVYSSPFLLAAAIALIITAARARARGA